MWERGEGERPARRALALLPSIDAQESVGTRDAALLALREQLFGSTFAGVTSCPVCAEEIELEFDASEVRRGPSRGTDASFRLPTTADLAAIEDLDDVAEARRRLFERCVLDASIPEETIVQRMAECDPQADVQIEVSCPACEHRWREPFDIAQFLWTEVSVFARRLLGDVHDLARAYGWSERDILSLSPARRAAYLELVR